jgi:hypothetical protein
LRPDSLQAHFQARDLRQGPADVPIEQEREPRHDARVVVQSGDVSVTQVGGITLFLIELGLREHPDLAGLGDDRRQRGPGGCWRSQQYASS